LQESAKKEEPQPSSTVSLKPFLRLKSTWLVLVGAFMVALSPFFDWAVGTFSFPILFGTPITITITGYAATWNLALGPLEIVRMIYFQLASLALAVLALLLRIFLPTETPKRIRSIILLISGILGITVPAYFTYISISQAQQLISQFQWVIDLLKTLNIQPQYSFSIGYGLILAVLGPILLLISGVLILREKT